MNKIIALHLIDSVASIQKALDELVTEGHSDVFIEISTEGFPACVQFNDLAELLEVGGDVQVEKDDSSSEYPYKVWKKIYGVNFFCVCDWAELSDNGLKDQVEGGE